MESEATSNGLALAVGIVFAAFGVFAILALVVSVAIRGWNGLHRILGTRLSIRAARLEDQRQVLAFSLSEALGIIEKLGPEGWRGLDRPERVKTEDAIENLRRIANNHDPDRRPDCLILP